LCVVFPAYPFNLKKKAHSITFSGNTLGFDHGVGHSFLLLYDAKAPHYQKSKEFKGLSHYPANTALDSF
jgi:hypothetical protein